MIAAPKWLKTELIEQLPKHSRSDHSFSKKLQCACQDKIPLEEHLVNDTQFSWIK